MQLKLQLSSDEQLRRTWAFAMPGRGVNRRQLRSLRSYVITSCSKEAKALGVSAGMRYEEAKLLIPDIKILTIGNKNA
jgi:hypothetical protein